MTYLSNVYVNITALTIALIFTSILFSAMLFQKIKAPTTSSLSLLAGMEVLILMGQIIQWIFYALALDGKGTSSTGFIDSWFFCLDFALMYFSLIVFYRFFQIYIEDTSQRSGQNIHISDKIFKFFLILGCVASIIFTVSGATQTIFSYDNKGFLHPANTVLYLILIRSNTVIYLVCIYYIIKYRKTLGSPYCLLLLSYIVVRFFVLPFDVRYAMSFTYIALAVVIFIFYLGIDRRRTVDLLSQQIELAKQRADLEEKNTQIMVSQIQPHFMYNTLSVIDYLCGKDPKLASQAINKFSDYLRANMKSLGSSTPIPFEKELEHTKSYLWIEKLRFPDILEVEYDITVTDFRLPALTLQPLVENAVKHGIRGNEDGGKIIISTRLIDDNIFVYVEDNGIGFDSSNPINDGKTHVGIANVRSRLHSICNGNLEIQSTPGKGTCAKICIKKSEDK